MNMLPLMDGKERGFIKKGMHDSVDTNAGQELGIELKAQGSRSLGDAFPSRDYAVSFFSFYFGIWNMRGRKRRCVGMRTWFYIYVCLYHKSRPCALSIAAAIPCHICTFIWPLLNRCEG